LVAYVGSEWTKAGVIAAKACGRSGGQPVRLIGERVEHAKNLLKGRSSGSAVVRPDGCQPVNGIEDVRLAGGGAE
jgi:hypothetical protein